ncbi:hypothetical protein ABH945_006475 [Paraburkholderia sp. GAS333]
MKRIIMAGYPAILVPICDAARLRAAALVELFNTIAG